MKTLFLDCISGISGDMIVGALCDLGVKPSAFEWALGQIDIGDFHLHFERQQRQAIEGVKFTIHEGATHTHEQDEPDHAHHTHHEHPHDHDHGDEVAHSHSHEHHHEHAHAHHAHSHARTHAEIRALIEKSDLSKFVKFHALSIFQRLAVAEGKIHGMPPADVHFHEVGALDSIADVICACAGIEALGVGKVFVSPLFDGRGWIDCAHGKFPIPAPATLEILAAAGVTLAQIDEPMEFITPTGAAIAAEFGAHFGNMPAMRAEKIGYGVGARNPASRPNVLRAVLGEMAESLAPSGAGCDTDTITRIETNIDDLSPELLGATMEKIFAAGALDVFFTPIQMKKNRPAVQLTALCDDASVGKIADVIFSETSSFGVRMDRVKRLKLARKFEKVKTEFGEVTMKIGIKNGAVIQASPEFESVRALSEKCGQPLRLVHEAAMRAFSKK